MEWTPIAFGMFKASALGIGMYYAIKWHYDQGGKEDRIALRRTGGVVAAAFLAFLLVVGTIASFSATCLGWTWACLEGIRLPFAYTARANHWRAHILLEH